MRGRGSGMGGVSTTPPPPQHPPTRLRDLEGGGVEGGYPLSGRKVGVWGVHRTIGSEVFEQAMKGLGLLTLYFHPFFPSKSFILKFLPQEFWAAVICL